MDLKNCDNRRVRVRAAGKPADEDECRDLDLSEEGFLEPVSIGEDSFDLIGMAEYCPADYGLVEFDRDDESINVGGYQLFRDDIISIEIMTNEIDEYIAAQRPEIQPDLYAVRAVIAECIPDAVEKISYQMPTWWRGHNLTHFAAQKKHIGLYPGPDAVAHFSEMLDHKGFKYSKGAIQFPYDKIELDTIGIIAEYCGKQ